MSPRFQRVQKLNWEHRHCGFAPGTAETRGLVKLGNIQHFSSGLCPTPPTPCPSLEQTPGFSNRKHFPSSGVGQPPVGSPSPPSQLGFLYFALCPKRPLHSSHHGLLFDWVGLCPVSSTHRFCPGWGRTGCDRPPSGTVTGSVWG